jgi:hypothetical protein
MTLATEPATAPGRGKTLDLHVLLASVQVRFDLERGQHTAVPGVSKPSAGTL